jgi:uncharacterized protein
MSLLIPLAQLAHQTVRLEGELEPSFLGTALDERVELIRADRPLAYEITVRQIGSSILVEGWLRTELACQCARCLRPFRQAIELAAWSLVLPLEGEEQVPLVNDAVDLTPYVREDTLLALPQHPLCDPECRGLRSAPSGGAKDPDTAGSPGGDVSAWAALDRLKL